jgi:hypothetical protein
VKKRVERSYQDAAVVITTYEGKHTHPIPATLRGSSHLLAAHHHAGLHHHPHFRMPPAPALGALAFRPGAGNAFDALSFLQQQQQQQQGHHHHAMPPHQLVTGVGAASVSAGFQQVNAAMGSQHALPDDHQHGLVAIAGTAGTTAATTATVAAASSAPLRMQHFMAQDYAGLLQDMFPSFVHSNDDGDDTHHH